MLQLNNKPLKVIISGGGTGGHIFPAIAIANKIKERYPDTEILFVGAIGKMEMEKVPAAGYPIEGLWISGIQRNLTLQNLAFPLKLLSSLYKAAKIIRHFKPDIAIGVGGFASGPLLAVASWKNIPTLIQEQNSYPGITNRLLAKKVDKICVAYQETDKLFPKHKIVLTGNPIRKEILNNQITKEEAAKFFGLDPHKTTILAIGGSLGARTINHSIEKELKKIKNNGWQIIWQTGKQYIEEAKKAQEELDYKGIYVDQFIMRMDMAYSIADIIISRAGAIAISELCNIGKPTILIPSPNVAEDHQTKNALALVNKNAAIMIKDCDAREKLGDIISDLIKGNLTETLAKNIKAAAIPDAADRIVNEIEKLIR